MPEAVIGSTPGPAQVDNLSTLATRGGAGAGVAMKLLQSGFNVDALRPQDTLRRDDWIFFDNTVVDIARTRLIGIADLIRQGLVMNLPNALGHTRVEWERIGDMDPAEISMAAVTEGR